MSAFVTADLHLGHVKSLSFLMPSGERLRPFASIDEMHNELITRWNKVVNAKDRVYILGDVAITRQSLKLLPEFNGNKVLIKGNHDIFKLKDYLPYFEDIRGAFVRENLVFTHIPIHRDSFEGRYIGNIHGHLHCHTVTDDQGQPDKRYYNACVERHNFAPVALEDIKAFFKGHDGTQDVQYSP
jgi:calcineurin-like phosphoesterase family protein